METILNNFTTEFSAYFDEQYRKLEEENERLKKELKNPSKIQSIKNSRDHFIKENEKLRFELEELQEKYDALEASYNEEYDTASEASDVSDVSEVSDNDTPNFEGMTLQSYGKGYLLECSEDHADYGTKYYHNGWWNANNNAWFFKKEYYDFLVENGADVIPELEELKRFAGMRVKKYGAGWMLIAPNDHPDYGTKYYHNGWWNKRQNGWFFKNAFYDYLIENGAEHR